MRVSLIVGCVLVLVAVHVSAVSVDTAICGSDVPNCPFSPARCDYSTGQYYCSSKCSDGSTPSTTTCQPCQAKAASRHPCPDGTICVDNFCSRHPVTTAAKCTATCVTSKNCYADPCSGKQKCPTGKQCQADYRFGCGFTCEPICTYNNVTYQVNDSRPYGDGCNTCSCTPTGVWRCTSRPCQVPTTTAPTDAPTIPKPRCSFGEAIFNNVTNYYDCPSTCSDGISPNCFVQPCAALTRQTPCANGMVCVDNLCDKFPVAENGKCTAKCVQPVNCLIDPCLPTSNGLPKCPIGTTCKQDYTFGCDFTCEPSSA